MGQISKTINQLESIEKINELSVVIYTDSFFYGLWTPSKSLVKSDEHSLSNFGQLLKVWNNNYDIEVVRVLSAQKPYVHLLEEDFEQKYFEHYFNGIYDVRRKKGHDKEVDLFDNPNINTLHYVYKDILAALKKYDFPFKIGHISTALANYAGLKDQDLLAVIAENALHIVYKSEGKFKFYNQFYCKSATDYLYYLLLIMKSFNLNPHTETVHLGGHIVEDSPLYKQLKGYIAHIKLVDQNIQLQAKKAMDFQIYFDLYLCRSCV